MERERWSDLSTGIFDVRRTFPRPRRCTHGIDLIVRVYLWAVLHDRPVCWACVPWHWTKATCPQRLPTQSTMSRRMRTPGFTAFLQTLSRRLAGPVPSGLLKWLDGKPLTVSRHSQDADATWGRGAGGLDKGYKLHVVWGSSPMPLAWSVHPLNVSEKAAAFDLLPALSDAGYVLADANYDHSGLYDLAAERHHQLLAPRRYPGAALGHHYQSPHRRRAIELLEGPGSFGRSLFALRRQIETRFAGLTSFGGGLTGLPPWVRTLPRVRLYVHAKLLINAVRLRRLAA